MRRKKKRVTKQNPNEDSFHKFASLQSSEGIKLDFLKNLYKLLTSLSSVEQWNVQSSLSSHDFTSIEVCHEGVKLTFQDAFELSEVLFEEIEKRFNKLISSFLQNFPNKDFYLSDAVEVLTLLFRCCMLLLILRASQQNFMLEKGLVLLRLLKMLTSLNTSKNSGQAFVFGSASFQKTDNGVFGSSVKDFTASLQFLEPCSPVSYLKFAILEAFIDELLAHGRLRGYFKLINSRASFNEILFNPHHTQCDTVVLIEALCCHFLESFSGKQDVGEFLSQVFSFHAKELKYPLGSPALSIKGAVSLLLSPIMVSAPKYLQFHLISLVSEVIDIKILKPDNKLINCFLSTFEKSVILYMAHMYSSQPDGCTLLLTGLTSRSFKNTSQMQFESYISPETRNQIGVVVSKLYRSSDVSLSGNFFELKSDMVSSCLRFVKECQNLCSAEFQDQVVVILSCLVLKASETFGDETVLPIEGETLYHICVVSSLLKLMSTSLLQAIRCLRYGDGFGCMKTLKDFTSCKEYNFILGAINCFRSLDASLPLQQILSSVMVDHSLRNVDSKMLFLHFSGLLSLGFATGLGCLAKGCLLILQAILNLFIFEDGGLDSIVSMVHSLKEFLPSESSVVRIQESSDGQNSSLVVASKFQKIRSHYSRKELLPEGLEEETEETCNGEMFFKCILKEGEKASSFNDIVDFVECRQGRDYPGWLKNRERYRRRRYEKMAVLRWKRRKRCWRKK